MKAGLKEIKAATLAVLIAVGWLAQTHSAEAAGTKVLTVAGGCFWCVEADFESVAGVAEVVSGFTGGSVENPSYSEVKRGGTGHFEAVQIVYDPARISQRQLLDLFFRSIDPTDAGGQFCDRGATHGAAIFVADGADRAAAKSAKAAAEKALGQRVVTPILPQGRFYRAGPEHQDYYKGQKRVITRFGIKRQAVAYKRYRKACGRDQRVKTLWGDAAPFVAQN